MAISFVNRSFNHNTNGSEPASVQQGDVMLAILQSQTAAVGPAGWTQIGATRQTGTTWFAEVWFIVRGATAPSYTWTNLGTGSDINVHAWRGARATIDVSGQSAAGSAVSPSVTTTVPNGLLVCLYEDDTDTSLTVPAGMTSRSQSATTSAVAELALGAVGATGTKTFGGTTTPIAAWSVALAPVVAPPPFQQTTPRVWTVYS